MSLIDDLKAGTEESDLNRREALGKITGAVFAVAGLGTAITTIKFLKPNVLFEPPTKFVVGRPDEIPVGTMIVMPEQKLYVVHSEAGFFAMSASCPHLGCMTRRIPGEGSFFCPCHGSRFDLEGSVTAGPAPAALTRLHLSLENGELIVDSARLVEPDFVLEA